MWASLDITFVDGDVVRDGLPTQIELRAQVVYFGGSKFGTARTDGAIAQISQVVLPTTIETLFSIRYEMYDARIRSFFLTNLSSFLIAVNNDVVPANQVCELTKGTIIDIYLDNTEQNRISYKFEGKNKSGPLRHDRVKSNAKKKRVGDQRRKERDIAKVPFVIKRIGASSGDLPASHYLQHKLDQLEDNIVVNSLMENQHSSSTAIKISENTHNLLQRSDVTPH
jgi:hypothetical protein